MVENERIGAVVAETCEGARLKADEERWEVVGQSCPQAFERRFLHRPQASEDALGMLGFANSLLLGRAHRQRQQLRVVGADGFDVDANRKAVDDTGGGFCAMAEIEVDLRVGEGSGW